MNYSQVSFDFNETDECIDRFMLDYTNFLFILLNLRQYNKKQKY